jgi:hypothetical protein
VEATLPEEPRAATTDEVRAGSEVVTRILAEAASALTKGEILEAAAKAGSDLEDVWSAAIKELKATGAVTQEGGKRAARYQLAKRPE